MLSPTASVRLLLSLTVLTLVVSGCAPASGPAPTSAATPAPPPAISIDPSDGAAAVRPDHPVHVSVKAGRLAKVTVARSDGQPVPGDLTTDASSWTATDRLDPGQKYQVSAQATGVGGSATATSVFTTVTGQAIQITKMAPNNGDTVGVAMPIVLVFSAGVAEAQQIEFIKHLTVTSTPPVVGDWHWWTLQTVHFRPKDFWPAHTKVTVTADLRGIDAGQGHWGVDSFSRTFTIGDKHVATIDNNTHMMTVTVNDAPVAQWPASLGKAGFPTIGGTLWIPFKLDKLKMSSCAAFGGAACVPGNANYYDENVYFDTAVSTDGYYIHAAPWSVADQGVRNVSHGCINLSTDRATAFYNQSIVGDAVIITNTALGATEADGEGDWQTPWEQYANSGPAK